MIQVSSQLIEGWRLELNEAISLSTYGTHRIRQNTAPPKVVRAFIDGEKSGKRIQVENRDWSEFWVKSKMYIYGHK